jgi:hypothetical protein
MEKLRTDWGSIGQLALALVGVSFQMGLALLMIILGATQLITTGGYETALYSFMPGVSMAAVGMLMFPSAYYALMRILSKKPVDSITILSKLRPGWWILALPLVLWLGYFVAKIPMVNWLLLPLLQVLAIGIPSLWMLYLAIHRLPTGSSQRMWGVFNAGLLLAPAFIVILELLVGFGFLIIGILYISSNPHLADKITALAEQLRGLGSQQEMLKVLSPYLVSPIVLVSVLVFAAIAVPLIEELTKPIGVWLLVGRKLSPAAGFAAGAISGGGYGIVESLLFSASGQDWLTLVLARNGTTSIHILTSALMGWALVQAWQKKRFMRLVLVYICAVLIHGTWNGLTLIFTFNTIAKAENLTTNLPLIAPLGSIAMYVLVFIAVGCFLGIILINRALGRKTVKAEPLNQEKPEMIEA